MSEYSTNFIIGATFDAARALSQLNAFIESVNRKAREASERVQQSLIGGVGAVPVADISKDMRKVEALTSKSAARTAKDYEAALSSSSDALTGTRRSVDSYARMLAGIPAQWEAAGLALIDFGYLHQSTIAQLIAQVSQYGVAVDGIANVLNTASSNLTASMAEVKKSTETAAAAQAMQTKEIERSGQAMTVEEKRQRLINNAAEQGVEYLSRRVNNMREEQRMARDVLEIQQKQSNTLRDQALARNDLISTIEATERRVSGEVRSTQYINELNDKQRKTMTAIADKNQQIAETKTRIAKIDADISRHTGNFVRSTALAAQNLAVVLRRVILWSTSIGLVFGTIGAINQAMQITIKLQDQLIQISKIQPRGFDVQPLKKAAIDTAVRYGLAINDIAENMVVFAQQGLKTDEIISLIDISAKGMIGTNLSMKNSVEILTAAMNIFGVGAIEVETILDKLQKVQADFAVTTEDLADAMRLLGPVVNVLGGDMDFLLGSVTAVGEATRQSGKFVGNALKTIFASLPNKESVFLLKSIGVDLTEGLGQLRPLDKIMGEIAAKWPMMSDSMKQHLAIVLGGIRRYNVLITLMDNYQTALDSAAASASSFGSTQSAVDKAQQSYQIRLNQVRASVTKFGVELSQNIVPILVNTAEAVSVLANKWVALGVAAVAAPIGIVKLVTALSRFGDIAVMVEAARISTSLYGRILADVVQGATGYVKGMTASAAATAFFKTSVAKAAVALRVLGASIASLLPAALIIGGIYLVLKKLHDHIKATSAIRDQMAKSFDRFKQLKINFNDLDALTQAFVTGNITAEQYANKLKDVGVQGGSTQRKLEMLHHAQIALIEGFSTIETIKEIKKAEKELLKFEKTVTDGLTSIFANMDKEKVMTLGFEIPGMSPEELADFLEKTALDAANRADLSDAGKTYAKNLAASFKLVAGQVVFDTREMRKSVEDANELFLDNGVLADFSSKLVERRAEAMAKSLLIEKDNAKQISKNISVKSKEINLYSLLIDQVVKLGNADDEATQGLIKQLRILQQAASAIRELTVAQERHILKTESEEEIMLKFNQTWINLLDTLDELQAKQRTQENTAKRTGTAYNAASEMLSTYNQSVEAHVKLLEDLPLLQSKYSRAVTAYQRQQMLSLGQPIPEQTDAAGEMKDDANSMVEANQKLVKAAAEMEEAMRELERANGAIGKSLSELEAQFGPLVDGIKRASKEVYGNTDALTSLFVALAESERRYLGLSEASRVLGKDFDVVDEALKASETNITALTQNLVNARLEFGQASAAIGKYQSEINKLNNVPELSAADRLSLGAEALDEVAASGRSIYKTQQDLSAEYARQVRSQAIINKLEAELQIELSKRAVLVQKSLGLHLQSTAVSARQLSIENELNAVQLSTAAELARYSTTNMRTIELTNRLYSERTQAIVASGLAEAESFKTSAEMAGRMFDPTLAAMEIASKKRQAIIEEQLGRLTALRQAREELVTQQYELQKTKLMEVGDEITKFYTAVGDLLTRPIMDSIEAAGTLGFKIRQNTRLYETQRQINLDAYNTGLREIELANVQGRIDKERSAEMTRQLSHQYDLNDAALDFKQSQDEIGLIYADHMAKVERVKNLFSDTRTVITDTAGDFRSMVDDAHVFSNLFDEIGQLFFKSNVQNLFDNLFKFGDDNIAKMIQSGEVNSKVNLLVQGDTLQQIQSVINQSLTTETQRLDAYIATIDGQLKTARDNVVESITTIYTQFLNATRALLEESKNALNVKAGSIGTDVDAATGAASDLLSGTQSILESSRSIAASSTQFAQAAAAIVGQRNNMIYEESKAIGVIGNVGKELAQSQSELPTKLTEEGIKVFISGIGDEPIRKVVEAIQKGAPSSPGDPKAPKETGEEVGKELKNLFTNPKFAAGSALASLLVGSTVGTGAGLGISSGLGVASQLSTLFGLESVGAQGALGGLGAIGGLIYGMSRDREEERRRRDEERKEAEERRRRELEAARQRSAILDAAERVIQNTEKSAQSLLFAPTGFRIPSYAFSGGGLPGGQTNTFNISVPLGADARNVASEVASRVNNNYSSSSFRQSSNPDSYL